MNYYYDANGALTSIGHKAAGATAETYYFVTRNLQGDIMALYNTSNSSLVGTYTYDTWGRVTSVKDAAGTDVSGDDTHIMSLNPFRYRGYYYDRETGFYYLQSRYYDPETGRFLNADGLISTGTGVAGYNMYMYCNNNPVNMEDPTGTCGRCAMSYFYSHPKPTPPVSAPTYEAYANYEKRLAAWQADYNYYLYLKHDKPAPPIPPSVALVAPTTNYNRNNVEHSTDGEYCTLPGCKQHMGGHRHLGADILGDASTGIIAARAGKIKTGHSDGQGHYFEIISWDGTIKAQYQHCIADVGKLDGYAVYAGQYLGKYMGASGFVNLSGETKILHFQVSIDGEVVNPLDYIR